MTGITTRGFRIDRFKDANGVSCSMQKSSTANREGMIWLGANEIGLKRFTPGPIGWQNIDLDQKTCDDVTYIANNRMHLTQSDVRKLLPALLYFAETGELPPPAEGSGE